MRKRHRTVELEGPGIGDVGELEKRYWSGDDKEQSREPRVRDNKNT
jgi:hypothetical protein